MIRSALLITALTFSTAAIAQRVSAPAEVPATLKAEFDIVYGKTPDQELKLDVYRPKNDTVLPACVLVHGGGWIGGDKERFRALGLALAEKGYVVANVEYRLAGAAKYPAAVQDCSLAVRWVRANAKRFALDPQRIGAWGGSAGGHLSLMLATCGGPGDPNAADPVERESSAVQAATVFYPVTDLLNLGPSTENLHDGGPPKSFRKSFGPKAADLNEWKIIGRSVSPIFHITKALPPIFITHGGADTLVPLEQSVRFKQKAAELGRDVALTVRDGQKHGWPTMIWDAHLFAEWLAKTLR